MKKFKLSKRSLSRLKGIDPRLRKLTKEAIKHSKRDFGVTKGLRSLKEQKELKAKGFTQTLKSKHLEGLAVDVVPYIGRKVSWNLRDFYPIVAAFKKAQKVLNLTVRVRWGGAWHISNILTYKQTAELAHRAYVQKRKRQGRKPFTDAPHFEIML